MTEHQSSKPRRMWVVVEASLVDAVREADAEESAILESNEQEAARVPRTRTITAEPWLAAVDRCNAARIALANAVLAALEAP